MYVLQWRIRLCCCHGGREYGSMCKGGARVGVAREMMVVMLRLRVSTTVSLLQLFWCDGSFSLLPW